MNYTFVSIGALIVAGIIVFFLVAFTPLADGAQEKLRKAPGSTVTPDYYYATLFACLSAFAITAPALYLVQKLYSIKYHGAQ